MTYITEKSEFAGDDVPLLDTSTPVKGYDGTSIGPANEQAQVLANRTLWLKEKSEATDEAVGKVTDTTEKLRLNQTALDKRVTQVETTVTDHTSTLKTQTKQITDLDKRESDNFKYLVIGLGQATTDIAANTASIKNLESRADETDKTTLGLEDDLDQLTTTVDGLKKTVNGKQDALVSGKNINTVMGVALDNVREGGITLEDATDFAKVLQKRLGVGKGLTLETGEDDQSLMLNVVKEENLGSNLDIRIVNGGKSGTDYELKTKQRPNYNLRAFAFKASTIKAQPNLTVNFITDPNSSLASGYTDDSANRINFIPDTTTARWSSLKTLTIPQSSSLPDTRIAFSVDGKNWATYSTETSEWVDLGELKVDNASATTLVNKGLTLADFSALNISFLADWLKNQEDTPDLNLAFAATVTDASQVWTPDKMTVTFNAVSGWIIQSPYFVHVSITNDSIIFQPQSNGDFVFCFEFQK